MANPARVPHFADTPVPEGITPTSGIPMVYARIDMIADLPSYSIINGDSSTITPYLIRATIPTYAHWVPVTGMRRDRALSCVDAFVTSQIWQAMNHRPTEWSDAQCRKVGFILGVARAVMYDNFEISEAQLIRGETAAPVLHATFAEDGTPSYRFLAEDPRSEAERTPVEGGAAPRLALAAAFEMTDDERAVLPVLIKSAQAILPLQGYGLITDGHQYLSDRSKASFKAFSAVERQHWRGDRVKAYMDDNQLDVRDLLWHKAGHPVSIAVKQFAATDEQVKDKLRSADLGSAAVRLPAVESEVRAIIAFLRVTDAVRPSIETFGGEIDNGILREVQAALAHFPISVLNDIPGRMDPPPLMLGQLVAEDGSRSGGTRVTNRKDVLTFAKHLVSRCQNGVAFCFGYYMSMIEAGGAMASGGQAGRDTLARAFSLRKLQTECIAAYNEGLEAYKDVQALKARARKEGKFQAPKAYLS